MANHCYNWANIEGSKEMLDLFEKRLEEATKEIKHLWWETYFQVLGIPLVDGVSYEVFGSRWFHPDWERQSETSGVLSGDSAWSPVSEFFRKLSDVYQLEIESTYEECGCDFGGWYNCTNGEVKKDVCTSYHAYRFQEEDTEFFYTLIEDIENDSAYESIDDLDSEFISLLSETQKQELIEAFNKQNV
tara:strand:- start:1115 stop:1678 length:564 start_codon:yes stop_codon:yes gene_type:complete